MMSSSAIVQFREEHPEHDAVPIIWASTPDYCGSLQEGYAAAVEAIVASLAEGGDDDARTRSTCCPART